MGEGGFLKILTDYYIMDGSIYAFGLFGAVLIAERVKALWFDYSIKTEDFMKQVKSLVEVDKIEEAIAFCSANSKKPLAHVMKRILERADRDERSIETAIDIGIAEVAPGISKRVSYLSMIANVVTLVGLLGTVGGLIMSFQAVSFADPTQKQILLAQGISVAMHATAMGLCVAIPNMLAYSFLNSKQGKLFSDIDLSATQLLDLLRSRNYQGFTEAGAFPDTLGNKFTHDGAKMTTPPPSVNKASTKVS
jgi:biopolymer transport protein ExbB